MDFAANTHIIGHGGRTLATVEAGPLPYEHSYELDTIGPCDFRGTLPCGFAAHTKLDHESGKPHAIAYFWAWDHVQHVVIDAAGTVIRTTSVPVPDGPMMHDFALTGKYVVLLDLPVTFSLNAVSECMTAGRNSRESMTGSSPARTATLGHQREPRAGLSVRLGAGQSVRWSARADTAVSQAKPVMMLARWNRPP
jgi:carotenoid cleavage dioxygenase-like enzyme